MLVLTSPDSLLYDGFWCYYLGVKWPGHGITHPPPSSAEVKERIELYHYPSLHPHGMLEGEHLYVEIASMWLQFHSQIQKRSQGCKSAKEGEG
jgi:hypothetical protein